MRYLSMCSVVCVGMLYASGVLAAGDAIKGKAKSAVCSSCHNADGNSSIAMFPKLAGQNEDYIIHSLKSYQDGRRKNDIMKAQAATLSVQDINDLAAYFSRQQGLVVKR